MFHVVSSCRLQLYTKVVLPVGKGSTVGRFTTPQPINDTQYYTLSTTHCFIPYSPKNSWTLSDSQCNLFGRISMPRRRQRPLSAPPAVQLMRRMPMTSEWRTSGRPLACPTSLPALATRNKTTDIKNKNRYFTTLKTIFLNYFLLLPSPLSPSPSLLLFLILPFFLPRFSSLCSFCPTCTVSQSLPNCHQGPQMGRRVHDGQDPLLCSFHSKASSAHRVGLPVVYDVTSKLSQTR